MLNFFLFVFYPVFHEKLELCSRVKFNSRDTVVRTVCSPHGIDRRYKVNARPVSLEENHLRRQSIGVTTETRRSIRRVYQRDKRLFILNRSKQNRKNTAASTFCLDDNIPE